MKRSFHSRLGEIGMLIFGGGSSDGMDITILPLKNETEFAYFATKQNLQSRQIQDEFLLINVTKIG